MKKYFIHVNGVQQGPFSPDDLKMMNIHSQTPVWCAGMPGWRPAGEVPELQFVLGISPQSPQQPYYHRPDYNQYRQQNFSHGGKKKLSPGAIISIIGSVLVLAIVGVTFLMHNRSHENDHDANYFAMQMDSIMKADSFSKMMTQVDTVSTVTAYDDYHDADYYTGTFKNISGGKIIVRGYDKTSLSVTVNSRSSDGSCTGTLTGTGYVKDANTMQVTGTGSCTLTIFYVSDQIISVAETGCDADHGSNCSFSGAYQKK